jgi:hypothetical protein
MRTFPAPTIIHGYLFAHAEQITDEFHSALRHLDALGFVVKGLIVACGLLVLAFTRHLFGKRGCTPCGVCSLFADASQSSPVFAIIDDHQKFFAVWLVLG